MCDLRIVYTPRPARMLSTLCATIREWWKGCFGTFDLYLEELLRRRGSSEPCFNHMITEHLATTPTPSTTRRPAPSTRGNDRGLLDHDDRGRRRTGGGLRGRESGRNVRKEGSETNTMLRPLTNQVAHRVMSLAALMAAATAGTLLNLHLADRDGLWEIACAPHSWLSEAAAEHGLRPRRINLHTGFGLYQPETWDRLRELRRLHRPQRLWFSLPCTEWCPWTSVNYNTPELKTKLETCRRKERRLMRMATNFLKEAIAEDESVAGYWEWPKRCSAWVQPIELADHLDKMFAPWLGCRVDGCCYCLRDSRDENFIKREWLIKTADELFHRNFRAKVCPGNHCHTTIEGAETARTSYYPWQFVQAVCRHWRDVLVPPRHLRLASALHPLGHCDALEAKATYIDQNYHQLLFYGLMIAYQYS